MIDRSDECIPIIIEIYTQSTNRRLSLCMHLISHSQLLFFSWEPGSLAPGLTKLQSGGTFQKANSGPKGPIWKMLSTIDSQGAPGKVATEHEPYSRKTKVIHKNIQPRPLHSQEGSSSLPQLIQSFINRYFEYLLFARCYRRC